MNKALSSMRLKIMNIFGFVKSETSYSANLKSKPIHSMKPYA